MNSHAPLPPLDSYADCVANSSILHATIWTKNAGSAHVMLITKLRFYRLAEARPGFRERRVRIPHPAKAMLSDREIKRSFRDLVSDYPSAR